jgi:type IV pilus biogenesis protein PilP
MAMKTYVITSVALLAAFVSTMAFAESPATASAASDTKLSISEQVAHEEAQTALLMVQATNAKLREQIKGSDKSVPFASNGIPGGLSAPFTVPKKQAPENEEHVTSIQGAGSDYQAFIQIGGRTIIAEVGDTLSSGWLVTRITNSSVELSNGKKTRTLRI